MTAKSGRGLKIKKGVTVIAGVRTKTVTMNGSPVDVTTDDENGYRTYLAEAGEIGIDWTVEGMTKDSVLRAAALTNTTLELTDITIEYPNGDTLSGNVFMSSFEESGTYNDAVTFSATLQSSGEMTYTAAP